MKHWQNGDGHNFIFVWAGLQMIFYEYHFIKINLKTRLSSFDNFKLLVDITCFLCSNVSKEFRCDVTSLMYLVTGKT